MYFSVDVVTEPPQLHVAVTGEVDVLSASGLRSELSRRAHDGISSVVLDLDGVTFIDCTGLAAVLACQQEVASSGATFVLRSSSPEVRRLIELTGVAGRFAAAVPESA